MVLQLRPIGEQHVQRVNHIREKSVSESGCEMRYAHAHNVHNIIADHVT